MKMSVFSKENILKVLSACNPWWRTGNGQIRQAMPGKRFAYAEAMRQLEREDDRRAVILTGMRQLGKTTILYQMIETLLKKGTDPRRIVLITLENPLLRQSDLTVILECYHEAVYPGKDILLFCDELPFGKNWAMWLKDLYDRQPEARVAATASASLALMKAGSSGGAGHWAVIPVPPLSFYEYCEFLDLERPELPQLNQRWPGNMEKLAVVQKYFPRYLFTGGFPASALAEDTFSAMQTIREKVVDKALREDLPALYSIRSPAELERIFLLLCTASSGIISLEALAKELHGLSRPTLENYLLYLESANLIRQSRPVALGEEKILKASPKIYLADNALRSAVLPDDALMTDAEQADRAAEAAVYRQILFHDRRALSVGYYRGRKRGREIDIVVQYPDGKAMLLDIQYRDNAVVTGREEISVRCGEGASAMVLTKNASDFGISLTASGEQIIRIPVFAFLYLLGRQEEKRP